ncbi:MAG: HAMP domain-containing protein [Gallionellaceae bacterium]|nr:HAMP domain-containing protein [Gallionellaceae bacterium]
MKLATKFTLIFSVIILVMGYTTYFAIYSFQNEILEKEITEKLESVAFNYLDKLDRMFFEKMDDLDVFSANPIISSGKSTPAEIRHELNKFIHRYPYYVAISFFSPDRVKIASSGSGPMAAATRHSLTEYWPAVYEGKDHIVDISQSESLKIPTIHLVDRVVDNKMKTVGILVARVPVEGLNDLLEGRDNIISDNNKYKVHLLGSNGLILYSNHDNQSILKEVDGDFLTIKNNFSPQNNVGSVVHFHEPGTASGAHEREKIILAFAREQGYRQYKGNGWTLKIELAAHDAFVPIAELGKNVSIVLMVISLVAVFVILLVLSFLIVRPLGKINNAAIRLGNGDLDSLAPIESEDEIGKLAGSFNEMAAGLKKARSDLDNAVTIALNRAGKAECRIITISEETQQRIGQELHDDLGQHLTGIAFMSEVLFKHLKSQGHPGSAEASKITALINEAISKTRKLAQGLYPMELRDSGLPAMLRHLASNIESIYPVECSFICKNEESYRIDDTLAVINLFRIAQEAANNAIKHSGASIITLRLTVAAPYMLSLEVDDNGCGIDNSTKPEKMEGLGMHTMQYRASLLGGDLHIVALPGGGTRVSLNMQL